MGESILMKGSDGIIAHAELWMLTAKIYTKSYKIGNRFSVTTATVYPLHPLGHWILKLWFWGISTSLPASCKMELISRINKTVDIQLASGVQRTCLSDITSPPSSEQCRLPMASSQSSLDFFSLRQQIVTHKFTHLETYVITAMRVPQRFWMSTPDTLPKALNIRSRSSGDTLSASGASSAAAPGFISYPECTIFSPCAAWFCSAYPQEIPERTGTSFWPNLGCNMVFLSFHICIPQGTLWCDESQTVEFSKICGVLR